MDRVCSTYVVEEVCIRGFWGKSVGKRVFGRSRGGWESNIDVDV